MKLQCYAIAGAPKVSFSHGEDFDPLHLPQLRTLIHNNHPQKRKHTPGNMEAAGFVSACKEASWRFSADYVFPIKMNSN